MEDCTIYVGKLPRSATQNLLQDQFQCCGQIRNIDLKKNYAFIQYARAKDAQEAINRFNNRRLDGSKLIVQFKDSSKLGGSFRNDKKRPQRQDMCHNCGKQGHWKSECRDGDWSQRCTRCKEYGHVIKDCQNEYRQLPNLKEPKRRSDSSSDSSSSVSSSSSDSSQSQSQSSSSEESSSNRRERSRERRR